MTETMRMTRLQLLKRTGVAGLGLVAGGALLEACGGSSSTSATTAEAVSHAEAVRRLANATGTVNVLCYEGQIFGTPPKGVTIKQQPMAAVEDPINKKGTYDVSANISALFPQQLQAGVMLPMNLDLLPALDETVSYSGLVNSNKTPIFATIDGTPYGIGVGWSPFVVSYLKGVGRPIENLEELLEPEYRGKFGIGDEAASAIMMVAIGMGIGGDRPGYLTQSEFEKVIAKLQPYVDASKGIITNPYAEYPSQYARGEISAAFPDYNGTVVTAGKSGVKLGSSVVKGSFSYAETWFLGSGGQGTDADYAMLNMTIEEQPQYEIGSGFSVGVFNKKAMEKVGAQNSFWRDPEALLSKAPMREEPPLVSDKYVTYAEWSKRWQELKV